MKVSYYLTTRDLKGIPEEARHAEELGYDGLCTEETAHAAATARRRGEAWWRAFRGCAAGDRTSVLT